MSPTQDSIDVSPLNDRYQIIGELCHRDDAKCYIGKRKEDGCDVVVTVAGTPTGDERNALSHYAADSQQLLSKAHRNLVRVLDGRWLGDSFALVTERVSAPTLSELLSRGESLSNVRVATILREVYALLEWARSQDVVHRGLTADTLYIEPGADRVCATFVPTAIKHTGVRDAEEDDARTLGRLAWMLLARTTELPDAEHRLVDERPDLPTRVVEQTEALLRQGRDGEPIPKIPDYIASIGMADAIMAGELEAAHLQAIILDEQHAERMAWDVERRLIEERSVEQARRLADDRAEMERTMAAEKAALEQRTAEMEKQFAEEKAMLEQRSTEMARAAAEEQERLRLETAKERETLQRQFAKERDEALRLTTKEREEAKKAAEKERTELHKALGKERAALEKEREEQRRRWERERAAVEKFSAQSRAELERAVERQRQELEKQADEERAEVVAQRAALERMLAHEREQLEQERLQLEQERRDVDQYWAHSEQRLREMIADAPASPSTSRTSEREVAVPSEAMVADALTPEGEEPEPAPEQAEARRSLMSFAPIAVAGPVHEPIAAGQGSMDEEPTSDRARWVVLGTSLALTAVVVSAALGVGGDRDERERRQPVTQTRRVAPAASVIDSAAGRVETPATPVESEPRSLERDRVGVERGISVEDVANQRPETRPTTGAVVRGRSGETRPAKAPANQAPIPEPGVSRWADSVMRSLSRPSDTTATTARPDTSQRP